LNKQYAIMQMTFRTVFYQAIIPLEYSKNKNQNGNLTLMLVSSPILPPQMFVGGDLRTVKNIGELSGLLARTIHK